MEEQKRFAAMKQAGFDPSKIKHGGFGVIYMRGDMLMQVTACSELSLHSRVSELDANMRRSGVV